MGRYWERIVTEWQIGPTVSMELMTGFFWGIVCFQQMVRIGQLVCGYKTHKQILVMGFCCPNTGILPEDFNSFATSTDEIRIFSGIGAPHSVAFKLVNQNLWSFLALVCDANKVSIFENSSVRLDDISINNIVATSTKIGNDGASGRWLSGSVDDVRIYDRALSAEEIRLLYEAEAELPEQSVTSAKLSPALSDLIDGNGSLEQALPAGSVIAVKPGDPAPAGYTLFQRNEYNATLTWEEKASGERGQMGF